MPSYLVTGASRGIGFEFIKQFSQDPSNTVIGLVRNKAATDVQVATLGNRTNIHILQGDVTDFKSLQRAASETAEITGGGLDYLIANAALVPTWSAYDPLGVLGEDPVRLEADLSDTFTTNVIGNIHLFNVFVPLVLKGQVKKIIAISSGMADLDLIPKYSLGTGAPYSISKAAMNLAVAKFSAQYAKDGVLFMSICPGVVDTGHGKDATPEQMQRAFGAFKEYAPHFSGPVSPQDSVKDVISVIEKSSVAGGNGGSFVSHLGNKQWL